MTRKKSQIEKPPGTMPNMENWKTTIAKNA